MSPTPGQPAGVGVASAHLQLADPSSANAVNDDNQLSAWLADPSLDREAQHLAVGAG
jgi:hypothetical protein